jgi:6-phosphogluconolactonase
MQIEIFPTVEELNNFAAEKFIEIGNEAIKNRGQFTVALAGGSTPKSLYKLLASGKFKDKIHWKSVFFFFGDERNVPPDNEESNFRMAKENLFEPLKTSSKNIFRWQTELNDFEKTAAQYESAIIKFFNLKQGESPVFDLILLGMGDDGHTASLFPFTDALRENEEIAVSNWVEKLKAYRFTMTFPAIDNARNVIFLVAGENKAEALKAVLKGDFQPEKFPAQNVKPLNGNLLWLVDEKAAKNLNNL